MTFEVSTDFALIRSILANNRCYRRMVNDTAPAKFDAVDIGPREGVDFVIASEQGSPMALFLVVASGKDEAEVHFCFVPEAWGATRQVAEAFVDWVWKHYPKLARLIGPAPSYNRLAIRLAKLVGFRQYSIKHDAGTKGGKPFHLLMLELRRPR